jgi:hypothetical protein
MFIRIFKKINVIGRMFFANQESPEESIFNLSVSSFSVVSFTESTSFFISRILSVTIFVNSILFFSFAK